MNKRMSSSKDDDVVSHDIVSLHDNGIHFLSGEFDYETANDAITWLLESGLRKKKKYDHLTLIINSHGGDLACGFAIIDMMRASTIPVHTLGLGQISSCGLLTFIAGEKGHRILTPNTSILSHQWAGAASGKAHELVSVQKDFDLTSSRVLDHYQRCTGLDPDAIKTKLLPPHDVFLSANEAIQYNLCDAIKLTD